MSDKPEQAFVIQMPQAYNEVIEAHRRLHNEIDQMSSKIDVVIDKNEGEFLVAYQNHIRKIKIELTEIKDKTDAHEKAMSQNERLSYLEKQVTLFREEALKLYDRLEEKKQEAELAKIKSLELEKTCKIIRKEIKEQIKQRKVLETKLSSSEERIQELEGELQRKIEESRKENSIDLPERVSQSKSVLINIHSRLKEQFSKSLMINKTTSLGSRRKSLASNSIMQNKDDGELKDWFLECVKSIKRDVAQRKNTGEALNLNYVKNIQEFKMIDKLRLLEKFMENEKLLIWMYEKIFPSRMAEVKNYLSNSTTTDVTKKGSSQLSESLPHVELYDDIPIEKIEVELSKMTQMKRRKSEMRNQIQVKDGKLSLAS